VFVFGGCWFKLVPLVHQTVAKSHQTVAKKAFRLPQSPEDGSKQEAHADGIEEAHAILLGHPPVGRRVFGKHGVELNHERFGVLGLERQGLSALLWTAEFVQQLVILPAASQNRMAQLQMSQCCEDRHDEALFCCLPTPANLTQHGMA